MAQNWDTEENYYSGQGIVLAGKRGTNGKPLGLRPVGNVSDLKIMVATATDDHHESKSGQRSIDLRLVKETKVTISSTWENFSAENLAMVTRGSTRKLIGASLTAVAAILYAGMITPLDHIQVSAVVVKQGSVTLTPYVNDATPWDYQINLAAGSIKMSETGGAVLGSVATAVTVGTTTSITVPNGAQVGDTVFLKGFTGADAALINGPQTVASASSTGIVIAVDTTGKVITVAANVSKVVEKTATVAIDYAYGDQVVVETLTAALEDVFLRFEGLNTAEGNEPVIVEIFKVSADPLKELDLIADKVQQAVVEGAVLLDSTRPDGQSPYFRVIKLN